MQEGVYYHLYNRGVNKELLFYESKNYLYFLQQFDKYLSPFLDIYSFCLMPNHFHFLVKVKELNGISSFNDGVNKEVLTPILKAHRDFFISYAKSINKSYGRTGALFQYKFKRKAITNMSYLARLVAYIHLNPVRAGFCKKPDEWKFSTYHIILNKKTTRLKRDEVLGWFGDRESFIEFHQSYRDYQKEGDFLFKGKIIGRKRLKKQTTKVSKTFVV